MSTSDSTRPRTSPKDWLHAACLPFASRLLRGRRLRRQVVIAGVLALITLLSGVWLALGPGDIERDTRRELGLEQSRITRELDEHVVLAHDEFDLAHLREARQTLLAGGFEPAPADTRHRSYGETRLHDATTRAMALMAQALDDVQRCAPGRQRRLAAIVPPAPPYAANQMPWMGFDCSEAQVTRVELIAAQGYVPRVEAYHSPLGVVGVSKMIGVLAGGVLVVLLLGVAPLWVGSSVAQEVRDGTLQPLTGTALTSRQLAVGLVAGPLLAVAVLAAPFAAILLLSALLSGSLVPALGALVMLAATTALLSVLSEVAGLSLGRRRSPGVVGVLLMLVLGSAMAAGLVVAIELNNSQEGVVAMLPHAGIVHLLRVAVLGTPELSLTSAMRIDTSLVVGTVGIAMLAGVTLLAVERWLARSPDGLLRRGEAFVGAMTCSMLSMVVLWGEPDELSARLAISGMALAVPLLALLMARVPTGDTAPAMRTVPVVDLLAELGAVVVIHAIVCACLSPELDIDDTIGFGSFHTVWGIAIAGLAVIRQTAAPTSLATRLLLGVALFAALLEAAAGVAVVHDGPGPGATLLPFGHASPLLGLVELVALVGIPIALVESLRRKGVRLSATSPGPSI